MNVVLLGAPGSGKGTQAARLAERGRLQHVSSGELLRTAAAQQTPIGREVESTLKEGKLVPDAVVLKLVSEALAANESAVEYDGWILDGYPRTVEQARALDEMLAEAGNVLDAVVFLDVDAAIVTERLARRGRHDDAPETVRKRLDVYNSEIAPLLEFYDSTHDVYRIDGSRAIDEVAAEIAERVGL